MKKRIISMLLAGMMVLNSAVVYADADITGDYTTYADTFDSEDEVAVQSESAEENASADDNANIGVNETSVAENNADVAFTDGDSDEVDITEENPEDVSSQGETDENEEIQFAEEADDIFSENKVAVQDVGTTTASGTLATGVIWSLSENGNLQFSGSGAIEKDDGQDNYPWDMTQVVTVTIQSGITGIGSGAFADGTKLTKVFISADSLRTVSADAFKNCSNAGVNLYYSGNAPTAIPAFTGTSKVYTSVYYMTLRLTTDYSTDDWGFAVTKAYGTTHEWDAGVITKPAERDQTGTLVRTCQKCGEAVEEVIPAPYIVCGDDGNIFWGITPDHVLELSIGTGSGKGRDYSYKAALDGHQITTAPWGEYEGIIEGLRVKKGISTIMPYSFYGLTKLKWAEIEDSVISISYDAFEYCTALKRVKLSENLTNIDGGVFGYCSALEEISLPESITTIGWAAFESCTSLKSINIPKNLNKCAETTFGGCTNLRALYIEDLSQWLNMEEWPSFSLATFGDIKGIDYYIGGEALENLVIPENITRIRKYAFVHGHNIKTVTFHKHDRLPDPGLFSQQMSFHKVRRQKLHFPVYNM